VQEDTAGGLSLLFELFAWGFLLWLVSLDGGTHVVAGRRAPIYRSGRAWPLPVRSQVTYPNVVAMLSLLRVGSAAGDAEGAVHA